MLYMLLFDLRSVKHTAKLTSFCGGEMSFISSFFIAINH